MALSFLLLMIHSLRRHNDHMSSHNSSIAWIPNNGVQSPAVKTSVIISIRTAMVGNAVLW